MMTDAEIAFLNARLDEDKAAAQEAADVAGPDWTWKTEVPEGCDCPTDYVASEGGALLLDTMGGIESAAPFVARNDPARALREVEAKRLTIAACIAAGGGWSENFPASVLGTTVLRLLAAVYSDHPDYRDEWKPSRSLSTQENPQ